MVSQMGSMLSQCYGINIGLFPAGLVKLVGFINLRRDQDGAKRKVKHRKTKFDAEIYVILLPQFHLGRGRDFRAAFQNNSVLLNCGGMMKGTSILRQDGYVLTMVSFRRGVPCRKQSQQSNLRMQFMDTLRKGILIELHGNARLMVMFVNIFFTYSRCCHIAFAIS